MLEETGTKVSISTVKQVLYRQPERLLSKEEATAPKLWFATAHGDKDRTFRRNVIWHDEPKIELFGHNDHRYV